MAKTHSSNQTGQGIFQMTPLVLLLASWLVPNHFPPWVSWQNEVFAFGSMLCFTALWLGRCKNRGVEMVAIPFLALPLVLLAGILLMQWSLGMVAFFGDVVALSFYFLLCIFMLCAGFSYSAALGPQETDGSIARFSDGLAGVVLLGAALSGTVALVQTFDVWDYSPLISRMPGLRRPGGNIGQPNQLATLLLMGLVSLVYLFESKRMSAVIAIPLCLLLILCLATTESRTGVLSFCGLSAWWLAKKSVVRFKMHIGVFTIACVGLFVIFWWWPTFHNIVQVAGEGQMAKVDTRVGTRVIVWPQLINAMWLRPWFGWGLRGVSEAHNAVIDINPTGEPFTYAHNVVLDLAIGIGLPLTVVGVVGLLIWLAYRVRETKNLQQWFFIALIAPFAIHSMLEFPFAYSYLLVPVMLAIGALEGALARHRYFMIRRRSAFIALIAITTTMAWSVWEYISIEEDFRVVRLEVLHVGHTPLDYLRPGIFLFTQLDALLEAARIVPAPKMTPQTIDLARKVAMRFPWAATQNRYALSLALNGSQDEAIRQLKVMRAMHGETAYKAIRDNWAALAATRYPQLGVLAIP